MDEDLKKIKKLTAFMRKNGLLSLKQGNIELSLAPGAIELDAPSKSQEPEQKTEETKLTDLDLLFWSAPGNVEEMQ